MILEEITLGKDLESKRKAIQDNLGRHVILKDSYEMWVDGVILRDKSEIRFPSKDGKVKGFFRAGYDDFIYHIETKDGRRRRKLDYQDLNQLLVVKH